MRFPVQPALFAVVDFSPEVFVSAVLTLVLALIFGAWYLYGRREAAAERRTRTAVFRCVKCDSLYSCPAQPDTAPCPRCKFTNAALRF